MNIHKSILSLILAGLCAPATAAGARVDYASLDDAALSDTPRFIVKYKHGSSARARAATRQQSLDAAVSRARPHLSPNTANANGRSAGLRMQTLRATARGMHVVGASKRLSRTEAQALMKSIAADPNVEYVAVDGRVYPDALPNDPVLASHQAWHYAAGNGGARVTGAWDSSTGAGLVVAVIDTGITAHPDLDANVLPGYDFITDAFISRRDTDAREPGGWDLGNWNAAGECGTGSSARNSNWHGTHVAGTIAEVTDNGIGGAGVAPDAKVVPIRVLGRCGGFDSDVSDAIVWAAGGHVDGVADNANPAEVLNLSLGAAKACPQVMQDAINTAVSLGATVVVAAGNDNSDASLHSPASCQNVVTVGATGYTGQRASYSNYGASIDLAAPGGNGAEGVPNGYIWSTHNDGTTVPGNPQYVGMVGTSMAAPHVAGVAALMQAVAPRPLTPAQLEGLLVASARPFPVTVNRPLGSGILDASAAVERAASLGEPIEGISLTSGVAASMPPLAAGDEQIFVIEVPEGASRLDLLTYGGRGTLRTYAQYEAEPFASSNVGASTRPGTNQTITITAPAAGRYFLKVSAAAATAGALVRATVR
ncbi:S8 family peptidase [Marilutibacter aestuarii]|uniref:S8 family serine peptidase n=1 Tax=Marilutibacter aestuarii TaxID=1706195 RepID=A0A508AH84_9GAMM|nr:S8 family peptidase [Lysobacter aestuarii]TQD47058.1 S8 family serine peptidase [Lysobacter aestuarii]